MREKENNSNFCNDNVPSRPVLSRPSLFAELEAVKAQVEYESFAREIRQGSGYYQIDPLYRELCLIIAEMNVRPPESVVRVRGSEMEAAIVQEVYRELRNEHLEHVAAKFREQTHLIHKKTAYLQTALYNVLFEYDASVTNDLRHSGLI